MYGTSAARFDIGIWCWDDPAFVTVVDGGISEDGFRASAMDLLHALCMWVTNLLRVVQGRAHQTWLQVRYYY